MNEVPQLLVEWSSPWQEFVSAIGPALRRSPPKIRGEASVGLFPWRGLLVAVLVEVAAILATAVAHPVEGNALAALEQAPRSHDVIFFSANELPRTPDLGGAPMGSEGKSGGSSIHHAAQTIKVARGESLRERVMDAPQLNLPKSDSAIQNLLAYKAEAGPPPAEVLSIRHSPSFAMPVAPPPPELRNDFRHPQLAQQQVTPPPVELSAPLSAKRTLSARDVVVPPPVSAPTQALSRPARLLLPAEVVVAPRPEMNARIHSRADAGRFAANVVPPPVELNSSRTRSLGALNGTQAVAPPAVEVDAAHTHSLGRLNGTQVVAPPPVEVQNLRQHSAGSLGSATVAPPPAEVSSRLKARTPLSGAGLVAAPVETVSGKSVDAAKSPNTGVIVSPKPGEKPAQPALPERAMVAMSPAGNTLGAGDSGGGAGPARGSGSGSSSAGAGSGASFSGSGKGADASPRTGTSAFAGPGGAGDRYTGNARVPGASVSGGSNTITLPSFGEAEPSSSRSDVHKNSNGITIVASPRAGGAMNFYGVLKGDRVYTIYFKTGAGMVSLQFADPQSAIHPYTEDLVAPQALRTDISSDAPRARLVIKCVLDRTGAVKNASILQSVGGDFEKQVLSALQEWKFSPAFRGSEPVEVNAILGFGVDTK